MADKDIFDLMEEEDKAELKEDKFDEAEKGLKAERVNNALDSVSEIKKIFETLVSTQKSLSVGLLSTVQDNKQAVSSLASSMNNVADKMGKMHEGMNKETPKCPTKWQFEIIRDNNNLIKTVNVIVLE